MISTVFRSPSPFVLFTSILVASWVGASVAAADTVTVAWDPNAESDLAGYVVSVGSRSGVADRT
ncbi:MAG: hypothetical protein KJ061_00625, partial [Vicinamibacteraceae bacterium]|nr:hypothetical protein [Vicinamibacteraceae bacterium]